MEEIIINVFVIIAYLSFGLLCAYFCKWVNDFTRFNWEVIDGDAALVIIFFWPVAIIVYTIALVYKLTIILLDKMGFKKVSE